MHCVHITCVMCYYIHVPVCVSMCSGPVAVPLCVYPCVGCLGIDNSQIWVSRWQALVGQTPLANRTHYSHFLEELHSVIIRSTCLQQFYGHLQLSLGTLPEPSADCRKVARAQVLYARSHVTTVQYNAGSVLLKKDNNMSYTYAHSLIPLLTSSLHRNKYHQSPRTVSHDPTDKKLLL